MIRPVERLVSIALDGSESDPAVVRSSLALSSLVRRPVSFHGSLESPFAPDNQAAIAGAKALLGFSEERDPETSGIVFVPGAARGGHVDVGDSDAAPIVEMVTVPLALGSAAADVRVSGVTHGTSAFSFHELAFGWLPIAERLGLIGELKLDSAGFRPDGGGRVSCKLFPAPRLHSIDLMQRGLLVEVQAIVFLANLRMGIALPLEARLSERLRACGIAAQTEVLPLPAERGRGLAVVLLAQFERTRLAFVSVGAAGRSVETVADEAVDRLQDLLGRRGALPGEVAERLLVPLAVASSSSGAPGVIGTEQRGISRVMTTRVTVGLLAIAQAARRFLDVEIQIQGLPGDEGLIEIRPAA